MVANDEVWRVFALFFLWVAENRLKLPGFCSRGHGGRPLVGYFTYFKKDPPEARSYLALYLITLLDTSQAPHPNFMD